MSEFPTIVLESGWSESQAQLQRDCQLWLEGTAGAVKVVILYKMDPPDRQNQIKATMTFCRYVAGGAPVMISYVCSSLPYRTFFFYLVFPAVQSIGFWGRI